MKEVLPFTLALIWGIASASILMSLGLLITPDTRMQIIVGAIIGGGGIAIFQVVRFIMVIIEGGEDTDDQGR